MNSFMARAYEEALFGMRHNHGGPFGAVIVKDAEVLAAAHNEVLKTKDPTAHAEINVIREASSKLQNFDLSGCELYTTCEPCPMCLGAILWSRIDKVYYGATKEDAAKGGFDDAVFYDVLAKKTKKFAMIQLDHEKNAYLFDLWNQKEDKQLY